ncbi:AMP-binding protein [Klebsiella pneumoniae subsp. pneumoniae]|nr:AMP-binding protein [Klebsiella pneumoniae subsp. pneumoniae]
MLNNKEFQQLDFSSLHLSAGGGGMPVQQAVAERWVKLTGQYLLEGYGLTECSPANEALTRTILTTTAAALACRCPPPKPNWWMMMITKWRRGQPGELCAKGRR